MRLGLSLALLLALGGAVLLPGLGRMAAVESTDARYLEISREMYQSHDFLVPRLAGAPHLDKPPLTYWAGSLGFAAFGIGSFGGRFVEQLAVLATCLLLVLYGRRFLPTPWAFGAAGIFLTSALVFGASRGLSSDLFQLFFLTWAMLMLLEASLGRRPGRSIVWAGVLLGVSMLAKGPIALLVATAVAVPFLVLERARVRLPAGPLALGLLLFAAIGLPWYLWVQFPGFGGFETVFHTQVVERAAGGGAGHEKGPLYYLWVWPLALLPWTPVALASFWNLGRESGTEGTEASSLDRFLLAWSIVPVILFSLFATKSPNYILPVFPATALAVARAGATGRLRRGWGHGGVRWSGVGIAGGALLVGTILLRPAWTRAVLPGDFDVHRIAHAGLASATLAAIGALGLVAILRALRRGALPTALVCIGLASAGLFTIGFREVAPAIPSHRLAGELVASVPGARLVQHRVFSAGALFHGVEVDRSYISLVGLFCEKRAPEPVRRHVCLRSKDTLELLRSDEPTFALTPRSEEAWLEKKTDAAVVLEFEKHILAANPAALAALAPPSSKRDDGAPRPAAGRSATAR